MEGKKTETITKLERPFRIYYTRRGDNCAEMRECSGMPLSAVLKLAEELNSPQVVDANGTVVAVGHEAVRRCRRGPGLSGMGPLQTRVFNAVEAIRDDNPRLAREIRNAMPVYEFEDLTDPEAGAVLACLEEEGLL